MPDLFNSSFGETLSPEQVAEEVLRYIISEPERSYNVTIGTDSERLPHGMADFVTAIVVHRVGSGGRYFWRRATLGTLHTLRDRIIREVVISLDIGKQILELLEKGTQNSTLPLQWTFEIHADIGEKGETKAMIQEVVGMIRAYNFEPRTKPASYAASNVADRHV